MCDIKDWFQSNSVTALGAAMFLFQDVIKFMDMHVGFIGGALGIFGFMYNVFSKERALKAIIAKDCPKGCEGCSDDSN